MTLRELGGLVVPLVAGLLLGCGNTGGTASQTEEEAVSGASTQAAKSPAAPEETAAGAPGAAPPLPPPPLPREVVAACTGRAAGDQCSFTLTGSCLAGIAGLPAACLPDGMPPLPRLPLPPLPPEAVAACAGRPAGDQCSFTLTGGCLAGLASLPAVCLPDGVPLPPPPPLPREAVAACTGRAVGDKCSFTLTGGCLAVAAGLPAACLPDGVSPPPRLPLPPPPPPEAVAACAGRAAGEQCSFTLTGGCVAAATGLPAACLPARGDPPPR